MPLVVAVDEADQVAQDDAVLVAQPRARQDQRRVARVLEVDGDARGHELPGVGLQGQGRVQAGPQVEAGTAGRGVGGQLLRHARVEDLDVDFHKCFQ